jgi:hypothetical protein
MGGLLLDLAKAGVALAVELVRDEVKSRRERRAVGLSHRDVAHQQAQIRSATSKRTQLKVVPK